MQLALQLPDAPPVLRRFDGAGCTRLAETGDRILFPGLQLCRIQPLLAAPSAACRLIHRRSRWHTTHAAPRNSPAGLLLKLTRPVTPAQISVVASAPPAS